MTEDNKEELQKLAQSAFELMQEIGFTEDGETRMVESDFQRPIQSSPTPQDVTLQVPMLTIVPIPYIGINDVQVDFQMEVSATEKSSTEGSSSTNCFGGWSVNVGGKVSSSRENTRYTNQTARYQVDESNRQQRQTEGLSKLKDIMASCVEPLPTKKNDEE